MLIGEWSAGNCDILTRESGEMGLVLLLRHLVNALSRLRGLSSGREADDVDLRVQIDNR